MSPFGHFGRFDRAHEESAHPSIPAVLLQGGERRDRPQPDIQYVAGPTLARLVRAQILTFVKLADRWRFAYDEVASSLGAAARRAGCKLSVLLGRIRA
jgi:hypothetical protein